MERFSHMHKSGKVARQKPPTSHDLYSASPEWATAVKTFASSFRFNRSSSCRHHPFFPNRRLKKGLATSDGAAVDCSLRISLPMRCRMQAESEIQRALSLQPSASDQDVPTEYSMTDPPDHVPCLDISSPLKPRFLPKNASRS